MSVILLMTIVISITLPAHGQQSPRPAAFGDPPVAALIAVSAPDTSGFVTITGAPGAVFPTADVGIRNLYTYETVYVQAGAVGGFSARLRGTANTPFAIVPTQNIPAPEARSYAGSLPGGPGTIITAPYAPHPVTPSALPIAVDGDLGDWSALDGTRLGDAGGVTAFGVRGRDSLYLAVETTALIPNDYAAVELALRADSGIYTLRLTRTGADFTPAAAISSTFNRTPRPLTVASARHEGEEGGAIIEVRIPTTTEAFAPFRPEIALETIAFLGADDTPLRRVELPAAISVRADRDGTFRPDRLTGSEVVAFTIGGTLSRAESYWTADGRINTREFAPGAAVRLELDLELRGTLDPANGIAAKLILVPIAQTVTDGSAAAVPDTYTNNGWSNRVLTGGVAVDQLVSAIDLAETTAASGLIWRGRNDQSENIVRFPLTFTTTLPADLPPGLYGLRFEGRIVTPDGAVRWEDWPGFTVPGGWTTSGVPADPIVRLPIVLTVGGAAEARLPFALFVDDPVEGTRGVLPEQDAERFALSSRTRFNAPVPVLRRTQASGDPRPYALEPYLPPLLPNLFDTAAAPLIPFDFTSGTWTVTVTRPDGGVDDLGTVPLRQLALSTAALDESDVFGTNSPVDMARLSAADDAISRYTFSQYGTYTIEAAGSIADVWGNTYSGGGRYTVTVAEPLALHTAAPAGLPLTIGAALPLGARVLPGVPAAITMTVRLDPLDGGAPELVTITGRANGRGLFTPTGDESRFVAHRPGWYTLTAEARYRDPDGRLWAAASQSTGVIASDDHALIARGRRGVAEAAADGDPHPAWYVVDRYADVLGLPTPLTPYTPYFPGDVVWAGADAASQLQPALTVDDRAGVYSEALLAAAADPASVLLAASQAELPLRAEAGGVALHSWMRPGAIVRQSVTGGMDAHLPSAASGDDPLVGQIGAGVNGARPGDFAFLYGGVQAGGTVAGYAALAVYQAADAEGRIAPPGRARDGGGDGGPLFTLGGSPVSLFFWPTAARPGDVLTLGDPLVLAGQVAPTLPAEVTFTISAPDGAQTVIAAQANQFGWLSPSSDPLTLDQVGAWTIRVAVRFDGRTSAGQMESPLEGGLVGGDFATFRVFVAPETPETLPWLAAQADAAVPPLLAYNFNFTVPADWTDVQVYRVLTIPGCILEDGLLRVNGRSVSYQYSPTTLIGRFPMLEDEQTARGAAASDVRSLTLAVTGVDADGQRRLIYRTFTILYDRLVSWEGVQ